MKTKIVRNRTEQGQALVLIVLAIVGILGFAALAIDVGRIFAERRRAQGAADAAVLAWAYAQTQVSLGGTFNQAEVNGGIPAYASLTKNGYVDTPGRIRIELNWPPASGAYGPSSTLPAELRSQYMQVVIHTRVDKLFAQFVFTGPEEFFVDATARAMPTRSLSLGNAVFSTNLRACRGVVFNGGMTLTVKGGNVFSNSLGGKPDSGMGNNCDSGLATGGAGTITVTDGNVIVAGAFTNNGGANISPAPTPLADPVEVPTVPIPDCGNLSSKNDNVDNLQPGIYSSITLQGGDAKTMAPGMYCLDGNFKVGANSTLSSVLGEVNGVMVEGVMLFMRHGSVDFSGGANIHLKRPNSLIDAKNQQWGGMLIYMPASNDGGIDMFGNNGSEYYGTVYAPGPRDPDSKEKCNIGGNSGTVGVKANLMCSSIGVAGSANVDITYDDEENYRIPPAVELSQ